MVGVLLNVLLPNWLVLLPLCLLLAVVSFRTIRKGFRIRKKEQAEAEESSLHGNSGNGNAASAASNSKDGAEAEQGCQNSEGQEGDSNNRNSDDRPMELDGEVHAQLLPSSSEEGMARFELAETSMELDRIRAREARTVPWEKLGLLVAVWVGYTVITMLLYQADDVIQACSPGWIVLLVSAVPYVVLITYLAGRMLKKQTLRKKACDYHFLPGDVKWEGQNLNKYPGLAFFAGVAAAMMGIVRLFSVYWVWGRRESEGKEGREEGGGGGREEHDHKHTHSHTHTHTHTHARTITNTHTHTHSHSHTLTHSHTLSLFSVCRVVAWSRAQSCWPWAFSRRFVWLSVFMSLCVTVIVYSTHALPPFRFFSSPVSLAFTLSRL